MNRFVRKAAFSRRSPYWSVLPYNANWMLAENDPLISSLSSPIVFVDVGCRGGLPKELRPLRRKIHLIGFDADADECTRMNQENHGLFARAVYPFYISGRNGRSVFKLYKERGNSSSLDPDSRFSARFGGSGFSVDRTIELGCVTLDDFFREHPEIEKPDMIKLDTQGTELEVLTGAVECLETCSLVEVEVEFLPMYKDQALISEVMTFMADHGFELLYLNRVFQQPWQENF